MIRKNKDYWQKQISNWKESNQSPHKYCKKNGLIQSTFMRWVEKLEAKITPIKVDLPVSPKVKKEIIIEGNRIKIILPSNIEISILSAIIREVRHCS